MAGKTQITQPSIAYKFGFSVALSPYAIDANQDALEFDFCGQIKKGRLKVGFVKGWIEGYKMLREVKREISAGKIAFVKDDGRYVRLLNEEISLADFINSDAA